MSTYLDVLPKEVVYSLPYSDNSGDYLKVTFLATANEIEIEQHDSVAITRDKVEWLRDVLEDVLRLIKEQNDKTSVASKDAQSNTNG